MRAPQLLKLLSIGVLLSVAAVFLGNSPGSSATLLEGNSQPAFYAPLATTTAASYNWAGYIANQGTYTAVSATWRVPQVLAAHSLAGEATWVGIGGVESDDLIQAGTQSMTENGQVEYETWYETLPEVSQVAPLSVSAGDSITVALTEVGTDTWQILFVNNTTDKQSVRTVTYHSEHSSANWVEESPLVVGGRHVGLLPLVDFGAVVFRAAGAVKDGIATTPESAGATPLSLYSHFGSALAAPSVLGQDGASFSVTRVASARPSV